MAVFKQRDFVLSLAGLELIFFITAIWCCVFQTKPVLIIDHSSTYCGAVLARHQGFVFLPCCPHRADKKLEGNRAWKADPGWPKGYILCHIKSCSAIKKPGVGSWACHHCSECSWVSFCLSEVPGGCLGIAFSFLAYVFSPINLLLS